MPLERQTTRLEAYRRSQGTRRRIKEVFDGMKTVAGGRKLRCYGVEPNRFGMEMATASSNLGGGLNIRWRRNEPWEQSVQTITDRVELSRNRHATSVDFI